MARCGLNCRNMPQTTWPWGGHCSAQNVCPTGVTAWKGFLVEQVLQRVPAAPLQVIRHRSPFVLTTSNLLMSSQHVY